MYAQSEQLVNFESARLLVVEDMIVALNEPCSHPDILIVDDNVFNIIALELILKEKFKIKNDKALNGQLAIDKVIERMSPCQSCGYSRSYKLIVMDCNMPIVDGLEATTAILNLCSAN